MMGGKGSGQYPGNANASRAGRKPKTAVMVSGTGSPEMPDGQPANVRAAWDELVELTSGVTFSQDQRILLDAARLMVRSDELAEVLYKNPTDEDANRIALAVGRQLHALLGLMGLNPRSRQILLVPKDDEGEVDPLEMLRSS